MPSYRNDHVSHPPPSVGESVEVRKQRERERKRKKRKRVSEGEKERAEEGRWGHFSHAPISNSEFQFVLLLSSSTET